MWYRSSVYRGILRNGSGTNGPSGVSDVDRRLRYRRLAHLQAAVSATVAVLAIGAAVAGCGSSSSSVKSSTSTTSKVSSSGTTTVFNTTKACSSSATKISFWAWVPDMSRAVEKFNATHPKICVELSDVGGGGDEYAKITQALKAGTGAPDVAEIEYDELPSFEVTHSVVNLAQYGADSIKSDFVPWVWNEVSSGNKVYAIPGDQGPMGLYYNSVIFKKYDLQIPTTWTQFEQVAAELKKKDPSAYLTNFSATDISWLVGLMSQDDASPFSYKTGSKDVGIDFTGPRQQQFIKYWQSMIDNHYVSTLSDAATAGDLAMDDSVDVAALYSAWAPSYFAPYAKKTAGDWRAAALPQWTAGTDVSANWGGSSYPVFTSSKHPAQAAEFAMWLNSTMKAWNITVKSPSLLFPTYKPKLEEPTFTSTLATPSGTSHPFKVFAAAAKNLKSVEWPPFMTEVLTLSTTDLAPVLSGKETLEQGMAKLQSDVVSYAKAQGFIVSTS